MVATQVATEEKNEPFLALAIATALLLNNDPSTVNFSETSLVEHAQSFLTEGVLAFPGTITCTPRDVYKPDRTLLYCDCQQPYVDGEAADRLMCDGKR